MTYMNWKMNSSESQKKHLRSEHIGRNHSIDLPVGADIEIVQSFAPISYYDTYGFTYY